MQSSALKIWNFCQVSGSPCASVASRTSWICIGRSQPSPGHLSSASVTSCVLTLDLIHPLRQVRQ